MLIYFVCVFSKLSDVVARMSLEEASKLCYFAFISMWILVSLCK